jgi:hypothetical protein
MMNGRSNQLASTSHTGTTTPEDKGLLCLW